MENLTLDLSGIIGGAIEQKFSELDINKKIADLLGDVAKNATKTIAISLDGAEPKKVGKQHKQFERILKKIARGDNLILKGEAGNGKTHCVEQIAKALNIPFHALSVSNQSTKTDILGFVDANGVYRYNGFISAFKDGGIFCLDELDAGNPNVLTSLNSAISNGFVEAPNGDFITAHKNFRCVATANTVGRGANTKYVGRNKLDGATLDRFGMLEFELDEDIELMLLDNDKDFHLAVRSMRKIASQNYADFFISQRSSVRLRNCIVSDGDTVDEALEYALFKGCDEDIVKELKKVFKQYYKFHPKVDYVEPKVEKVEVEKVEPKVEEIEFEDLEAPSTSGFNW